MYVFKKLVVSHKSCGIASNALNQNSGIIVNENKSELYFDAINKILKNYNNYYEFRENAFNKVKNNFSFKSKKKLKILFNFHINQIYLNRSHYQVISLPNINQS